MSEFDLFGDITANLERLRPALGGVHREIIEASSLKAEALAKWGVQSSRNNKGWKSELQQPVSLEDMEQLEALGETVTIVSRKVGDVWSTGAADIPHDEMVAFLANRNYRRTTEAMDSIQRIETFKRRD